MRPNLVLAICCGSLVVVGRDVAFMAVRTSAADRLSLKEKIRFYRLGIGSAR